MDTTTVHLPSLSTLDISAGILIAFIIYWFGIRKLPIIWQASLFFSIAAWIYYVQVIQIPKLERAFLPDQTLNITQSEMPTTFTVKRESPESGRPAIEIENRLITATVAVHGYITIHTENDICSSYSQIDTEPFVIAVSCQSNQLRLIRIISPIGGYDRNYVAIIDNYNNPQFSP